MPQTTPSLLDVLTESEAHLLTEGLHRLREIKTESLKDLKAESVKAGGREFEPHDFGIPQIDALLTRLNEDQPATVG